MVNSYDAGLTCAGPDMACGDLLDRSLVGQCRVDLIGCQVMSDGAGLYRAAYILNCRGKLLDTRQQRGGAGSTH